jgi:hypothetical protein
MSSSTSRSGLAAAPAGDQAWRSRSSSTVPNLKFRGMLA